MRSLAGMLAALLIAAPMMARAIAPMDFDSPQQRERFVSLASQLRCLVCQNQSLADSDAPLAQELREDVLNMMKDGKSDDEIRDFLVARYGDFVLYDPPVQPSTWALWFGPFILLLVGAAALGIAVRRRSRLSENADEGPKA